MRISVMGCGHVGLVVAACLAKLGNKVTVVDIDEQKIAQLNRKVCPVYEEDAAEILAEVDIEATSDHHRMSGSDIIYICVDTPSKADGSISLEHITGATKQIASILKQKKGHCIIAVKSTVIPGTTEDVVIPILETSGKVAGRDFGVCMTPEFLREGKGISDFMHPDRIVIGEYDRSSGDMLCNLYHTFDAPVVRVNLKTAEMIKYASNVFLTTKVSFINEIGNICKQLGIDTYEVAKGMGYDERIGHKFLNAGIGFAGPCLLKDLKALIAGANQLGYEPRLLEEVLSLNEQQVLKLVELLRKHIPLEGSSVGILGLSYKPMTDDIKDSLAIDIANTLLKEGAVLKAYDPQAMPNFEILFPQIEYATPEEVLKCDAIIILTEWEEFERLNYRGKIVIDGRRVLKAQEAMIYEGVCW